MRLEKSKREDGARLKVSTQNGHWKKLLPTPAWLKIWYQDAQQSRVGGKTLIPWSSAFLFSRIWYFPLQASVFQSVKWANLAL